MSGHTPGPWVADLHHERQDGARFTVMIHGGNLVNPIAAVPAGVEGYGRDEGRANARLIAESPSLLNALIALANAAEARGIPCDAARATIARATGAAP